MQVLANVALYGVLAYFLFESLILEWDPWFAFVVGFLVLVAVITTLMPKLHAARTAPGEYPYDD